MPTAPHVERPRIGVAGASEALQAFVEHVGAGTPAGLAAARALVATPVDWQRARADIEASPRAIIVGDHPGGPVLAARFFVAARPSPIHDHGHAGAALVVAGRDRYERFERVDRRTARLESMHHLAEGDVVWWNGPPDDIHRQQGLGEGAIELVLLAGSPIDSAELVDSTPAPSELGAGIVAGFVEGDVARLAPWYAEDVFVDANVPQWRYQLRGRQALLESIDHEEFSKPDRRLTFLRATDTASGLLLETELRYTEHGERHTCRETHHLRVRDNLVVEHVLRCTGIATADTAKSQFDTAPMERM